MNSHTACQRCAQLLPSDAPNCAHIQGVTIDDRTPRACAHCTKPNAGTPGSAVSAGPISPTRQRPNPVVGKATAGLTRTCGD
jgi:hypothetical protein